jgi:hypothetical protein
MGKLFYHSVKWNWKVLRFFVVGDCFWQALYSRCHDSPGNWSKHVQLEGHIFFEQTCTDGLISVVNTQGSIFKKYFTLNQAGKLVPITSLATCQTGCRSSDGFACWGAILPASTYVVLWLMQFFPYLVRLVESALLLVVGSNHQNLVS